MSRYAYDGYKAMHNRGYRVLYDGWCIERELTLEKKPKIKTRVTKMVLEDFFLPVANNRQLSEFKAFYLSYFHEFFYPDDDNKPTKMLLIEITDKDGNPTPFEITKEQTIYRQDNGNALRIFFDDDNETTQPIDTPPPENELSERERTTMLKLIYGMAIDTYGYDPQKTRNDATGTKKNSISSRLKTHGLDVSDTAVRTYLNEAKEIFKT